MKRTVYVTVEVEVEVDEAKFTQEFLEEFKTHFYRGIDTVEAHMEYLAHTTARAVFPEVTANQWDDDAFLEGYGPARDMGILTSIKGWETE